MASTKDNLKEAFAGESQANQKYRAFGEAALKDGLPNIARLFRTTAEAERIHAAGHLAALEGIKSTVENLQAAIDGETYEFTTMYPPMLQQAESEDHKAKRMFKYAVQAEAITSRFPTKIFPYSFSSQVPIPITINQVIHPIKSIRLARLKLLNMFSILPSRLTTGQNGLIM